MCRGKGTLAGWIGKVQVRETCGKGSQSGAKQGGSCPHNPWGSGDICIYIVAPTGALTGWISSICQGHHDTKTAFICQRQIFL